MRKYLKLLSAVTVSLLFSQMACAAVNMDSQKDIVDVAMQDKNLSTLVTAMKAAGLVDTLKGSGPFTVFAPTNDAFAKLPKGTLDDLLKDRAKLASILEYHVVSNKVGSSDLQDGPMTTLQGDSITIKKSGNDVLVNNAKVVKADIMASNGVIHEIDTVLMPAGDNSTAATNTGNTTSTNPANPTDTSTNMSPGASTAPTPSPANQ